MLDFHVFYYYELTRNGPLIVYLDSLLFTLFCEFVMNLRHILARAKVVKICNTNKALIMWIKDFSQYGRLNR